MQALIVELYAALVGRSNAPSLKVVISPTTQPGCSPIAHNLRHNRADLARTGAPFATSIRFRRAFRA
jgi:hypothetical protein